MKRPPARHLLFSAAGIALRVLLVAAVVVGVTAALAALARVSPALAVRSLLTGAFGDPFDGSPSLAYAWSGTLRNATPILLTGLAVAWAFRGGLFNIGAEGQLLWGAMAAAWVGHKLALPAALHLPAALLAGGLAGALWAWPAALLKTRRGVSEVVTTLLLNWVALHLTAWLASGPLHDPAQQAPRTAAVKATAVLPALGSSHLHAGLLVGLALAVVLALVLARHRFGFQLRMIGQNPEACRSAGIRVDRVWTAALLQSGALAGLAGAVEVLAVHSYFQVGFSPGYGYDGIAVAILGASHPAGVAAAAVFWGGLANGAVEMEADTQLSRHLVSILQALVILTAAVRAWPSLRRKVLVPAPTTAPEAPSNSG
ncbi:MAG: ABC transporter permease [Armatimonadota bacterium]